MQIDKAANNSSVVIELEWHGWTLLLPADAEEKSWAIMDRLGLLRPAHFLKVSHHGSKNGTPPVVSEKIFPNTAPDGRRDAVVSTREDAYPGVPDQDTLLTIAGRAKLYDTRDIPPGQWIDISFDAPW